MENIHKAYPGLDNDIEEESQEESKITSDVKNGFYESVQLYAYYEENNKIFKTAFPDSNLTTAFAWQLED